MFLETFAVVFIKDGAPGIDVDDGHSTRHKQHERELHHVADLHQHDGGDEGQHSDIAVILGVLHAAILHLHRCSAVAGACVVLEAAKLEPGPRGGGDMGCKEQQTGQTAVPRQCALAATSHSSLRNTEKEGKFPQE